MATVYNCQLCAVDVVGDGSFTVPSPRGALFGLAPTSKAPSPPHIEIPLCTNAKHPIEHFLATVLFLRH